MSPNHSRMLTKKMCACLLALLFLLQGPAYLSANASQRSAEPVDDAVAEVESYSMSEKATDEVNAFLAGNPIRSQFLTNLTSKGVDPDAVKYIAARSGPASVPHLHDGKRLVEQQRRGDY